jgi:hypothetical protein
VVTAVSAISGPADRVNGDRSLSTTLSTRKTATRNRPGCSSRAKINSAAQAPPRSPAGTWNAQRPKVVAPAMTVATSRRNRERAPLPGVPSG